MRSTQLPRIAINSFTCFHTNANIRNMFALTTVKFKSVRLSKCKSVSNIP